MQVMVQFNLHYTGDRADAVWIIESASNREWFSRHISSMDQNSAVFAAQSEPIQIIENVFDHHPSWNVIEVHECELTSEIAKEFEHEAEITPMQTGFRLSRL